MNNPFSTIVGLDTNNFSVYRDRLIKKGVVKSSSYGFIEFILLRLNEFLRPK